MLAQNVKGNPDWIQGVVVEWSGPVTYVVEVILNGIYVLHRRHVYQIRTWVALEETARWPYMTMPVDVGKEVLVPETMMPDMRATDPVDVEKEVFLPESRRDS